MQKKLESLAFLDFLQPHVVAIQETKIDFRIVPGILHIQCIQEWHGGVMLLVHKDFSHMPAHHGTGKQLGVSFG